MKTGIFSLFLILFFVGCSPKSDVKLPKLPNATGKLYSELVIEIKVPENPPDIPVLPNPLFKSNVEDEKLEFKLDRKFSAADIELARKASKFVGILTGVDYEEFYDNFYWSDDLMSKGYLGMTLPQRPLDKPWNAYIVIASEIKPTNESNLNEMRDFGLVVTHEGFGHARNLFPEPLVQETIDEPISIIFHGFFHTDLQFYNILHEIKEKPKFKNLLELKAYESGLRPPFLDNCDWESSMTYHPPAPQIMFVRPLISTNSP